MTTTNDSCMMFTLPDTRQLSYLELGDRNGLPLLYFHGYPSSRLEGRAMASVASKHSIRLIAIDRPGWGHSSSSPDYSMLKWANDVEHFATGMRLGKFGVLGSSGGGPFALACARSISRDSLACVGLFACAPHWALGRSEVSLGRRSLSWLANWCPWGLGVATDALISCTNLVTQSTWTARKIDAILELERKSFYDVDGKIIQDPGKIDDLKRYERESFLNALIREPFRQGAGAAVSEARLLSADDWGFRLEDIEFQKVRIWHGAEDANSPAVLIRRMASKIPCSDYCELAETTHYNMEHYLDQAFHVLARDMTMSSCMASSKTSFLDDQSKTPC